MEELVDVGLLEHPEELVDVEELVEVGPLLLYLLAQALS